MICYIYFLFIKSRKFAVTSEFINDNLCCVI